MDRRMIPLDIRLCDWPTKVMALADYRKLDCAVCGANTHRLIGAHVFLKDTEEANGQWYYIPATHTNCKELFNLCPPL